MQDLVVTLLLCLSFKNAFKIQRFEKHQSLTESASSSSFYGGNNLGQALNFCMFRVQNSRMTYMQITHSGSANYRLKSTVQLVNNGKIVVFKIVISSCYFNLIRLLIIGTYFRDKVSFLFVTSTIDKKLIR